MSKPDLEAATQFIASNARVLDRRRYERLFAGGDAVAVRDAVAAYRNPDGGFGHGLEPDCRAPGSQSGTIAKALETLDEADAWDEQLVAGVCEWLVAKAPPEGGATFVDASIEGWPHAPWWMPDTEPAASLITTGQIAGTLHHRGVEHPWLERATELLWEQIEAREAPGGYEMLGVLRFLQYVPDRARAEEVFDRVGPLLLERGIVELDPHAPGEVLGPLVFAPEPEWLARRLFDEATIETHLDALADGQLEDGGWTFNWLAWSPVAENDWRGSVTVDALRVLRANGRLPAS